jgi:hypothetical protein
MCNGYHNRRISYLVEHSELPILKVASFRYDAPSKIYESKFIIHNVYHL